MNLRNVSGMILIVIGLAGVLLPIVPGVPLLLAGAAILGPKHAVVRYGRRWLRKLGLFKGDGSKSL